MKMRLCDQLKQCRLQNGYTQESLAELCGVSRQAVAKWENGLNTPDLDNLILLAETFDISLDKLLRGKESNSIPNPRIVESTQDGNERLINAGLRQAMSCDNPNDEIRVFIGYIGRMLKCDRTYVFERDLHGDYCNTYEWCNRNVEPQIDHRQGISTTVIANWLELFKKGHYVFIEDLEAVKPQDPTLYEALAPQEIGSLIVFPLSGGKGFFGVDNPVMAFASQTATLMELVIHFLESMLQRRDLVRRLLIETDQSRNLDKTVHRTRFYFNVKTGCISIDTEIFRKLGYHFEVQSLEELEQLLDRHPECRSHVLNDGLKRVEKTREASTIEFVFYTRDHLIRWMRLSIHPFLDSRGDLLQLFGTLQDISDEHQVIDRYNAFTTHLRGGMHICHLTAPCHLYYASDNLCELVGYTRQDFDEIVGTSYDSLIVDEDLPAFKGFVRRLTDNPGTEETCEYRLKHRNGSVVRVIDTMESVLDGNGIVYGYANVMDVSELHRTLDIAEQNKLSELAELDRQFEIVDTLSRDYYNIFLVDLERGLAVIHKLNGYVTHGMDKRSTEPIPYYDYCKRYIEERVHPDDREMMLQALSPDTVAQKLCESDEYSSSYRILDGKETRYCQFKFILSVDDNPHGVHGATKSEVRSTEVIAAFRSIDEMFRQELERRKAMQLRMDIINAFLEAYVIGFYVDLESYTVTELTSGSATINPPEDAIAYVHDKSAIFGDAREKMQEELAPDVIKKKLSNCDYICEQYRVDKSVWYEISAITSSRGCSGQVEQFFIMVRDISAEKKLESQQADEIKRSHRREREMEKAAYRDALTGVMNRAAYQRACEENYESTNLGIIFCDINGLKLTNDTYGHNAGDQLICEFAAMLKRHFSTDCIFRTGGDEFICMFDGLEKSKFEARVKALENDIHENGDCAAIGHAHGYGALREALINESEKNMYRQKTQQGKTAQADLLPPL